MSDPIAILDSDNKQVGPRYPEATDARKAYREQGQRGELPEGTYSIVRFLNEGMVVAPKPVTVANTVSMGTTYIKREPKASHTVPDGDAETPKARKGLFGRGTAAAE